MGNKKLPGFYAKSHVYPNKGRRPCQKCGKMFLSLDMTVNRICAKCNEENSHIYCREYKLLGLEPQ